MKGTHFESIHDTADGSELVNGFRIEGKEMEGGLRIVWVENKNYLSENTENVPDVVVLKSDEVCQADLSKMHGESKAD